MKWLNSFGGRWRGRSPPPWPVIFWFLALLLIMSVPTANGQSLSKPELTSSPQTFLTPSEMADLLVKRLTERVQQVAELQDSNKDLKQALTDLQKAHQEILTSLDSSLEASTKAQQSLLDLKGETDRQIGELKGERDSALLTGILWGAGGAVAVIATGALVIWLKNILTK